MKDVYLTPFEENAVPAAFAHYHFNGTLLVFKHLEQEIVLRELLAVVLCRPVFADQHFNGASRRCQTFLPSKPSLDLSSPASLDLQLTQQ